MATPALTAGKKTQVLQSQGTEFCQQPDWAWKRTLPRLSVRVHPADALNSALENPEKRKQ